MVRNEGLERSYNSEIAAAGQKELFYDVYKDYQSATSNYDVSVVEEFNDIQTDQHKKV